MKTFVKVLKAVIVAAVVVMSVAALIFAFNGSLAGTAWAMLPPIVAIALALVTKEVYSSLFIGITVGGFMACGTKFLPSVDMIVNDGIIGAVSGTAGIFVFLVVLGIIVALMNKAGGSAAFGRWAQKNIKSKTGACLATFCLGVMIFIDDYFNCLTVGSVMRPVTDSHKISRVKLAYLIDATAAPICMIAPVSSWAAAVSEYAEGTGFSGLELFIKSIPYNFYSILTLVFIVALSILKFDYGSMKVFEQKATNGDLIGNQSFETNEEKYEYNEKGRVIDLIVPVVILVGLCVFGLLYIGGILSGSGFIDAFGATDATVGLPWGSVLALILIIAYYLARRIITFKEVTECIPKGFIAMVPAILILTFATALKNITNALDISTFVNNALENAGSLQYFLPAIIFIIACILAFSTGTSWGTFGILIPIVVAIFPFDNELLYIGMSACLAGAVCGDHCSPISDTTIMSSAGAMCNHVDHVSTQMPYSITVALISFVCFIIAAFVQNPWVSLAIGIAMVVGVLLAIRGLTNKKKTTK